MKEAGRSRAGFGLEARIPYGRGDPGRWRELLANWRELGATHISLITTHCGLATPEAHINALRRFSSEVGMGDG